MMKQNMKQNMKSYYSHMNLPEPLVPAVQALQFAQGPDCLW